VRGAPTPQPDLVLTDLVLNVSRIFKQLFSPHFQTHFQEEIV